MKRLFLIFTTAVLIMSALFLFGCTDMNRDRADYTVRVLLPDSQDFDFIGSQIIENGEPVGDLKDSRMLDILPGQSVRFAVDIEDGMALDVKGDNVSYSDGYITVENVRIPTTLDVTVRPITKYLFTLSSNDSSGTIVSSADSGSFITENTTITLNASTEGKQEFLGFSAGNFLDQGGTLLSSDLSYSFSLSENTAIYANFAKWTLWRLNYHANGGDITSGGVGDILSDTVDDSFYYCPNTRPDKNYFTRDGYVLTGYNTEPDGSGTYYGLGWNVIMPEDGKVDLYCQWAKAADEEDFTYKSANGRVFITGYTGNDEFLVIPETIGGHPVTALRQNAFKDASFKEVYIPKSVTTLGHEAFNGCAELRKVNLSDSVITCYDDSFINCPNFTTLAPQATEYPHGDNIINLTYQVNYERLITRTNKIMLIVSGSCNVYGLTAAEVEKELNNEWDIITYSTIASTPCTMYAEIGLKYMDSDDILIFTPEASPKGHQWGTNSWEYYVWQIFEGAYDAISLVDISNYTGVFTSFSSYNMTRSKTTELSYEAHSEHFNEYGEYASYRTPLKNEGPWIKWNLGAFFTEANVNNFNRVLDQANDMGITTMIGWLACTNTHSLTAEAKDRGNQINYMSFAKQFYHAHFFGDLADYIYDPSYVYDSAMHLTSEGCAIRTKQVAKDISDALKELGIIKED